MFDRQNLRIKDDLIKDLQAGFSLFLIALPLSIGIALASGAPASAGLIAAIVGGVLGSFLGGGHININGPAAGLIVIMLSAVQLLGQGNIELGFQLTLATIVVAGFLQVIMGLLGWARIGFIFPSSVIHGMLTSIGLIIIIKQIYVALGIPSQSQSTIEQLINLPQNISLFQPGITLISLISLSTLLLAGQLKKFDRFSFLAWIPAPVLAVFAGLASVYIFQLRSIQPVSLGPWAINIDSQSLLNIPHTFLGTFTIPDFSQILTFPSVKVIITLALVASLESTLSASAIDKLDPLKRRTNLDRDLWSKGICNILSGLLGGLPIISEIVRSSANIASGARTVFSNFFHGLFIFIFVVLFPSFLNEIPLASLAILLIVVGWRLSHPSQFKQAFKIGPDHILGFISTLLVTLTFDLLVGILTGLIVELSIALFMGLKIKNLFRATLKIQSDDKHTTIQIESPLVFSNSLPLRTHILNTFQQSKNLTVNLRQSCFIDHTLMDQLQSLKALFEDHGLSLQILTSPHHQSFSNHALASRKMNPLDIKS